MRLWGRLFGRELCRCCGSKVPRGPTKCWQCGVWTGGAHGTAKPGQWKKKPGFWKRLFSRGPTSGGRWYFAADNARGLRQIVFELGGIAPTDSRFDSLILKPDKYPGLLNDLSVGFFKTDSDPGPYLLIKTRSFSRAMAHEAVRLGFTFCHMPSGPVFAVFAQSPTTKRELKGACFIDQVYSMDKHSGLADLITEAFSKDTLTAVFADSGGMAGIRCVLDAEYPMERSLREIFAKEWSNLVSHGRETRGWGQGSFAASREELYARTPPNESPILQR